MVLRMIGNAGFILAAFMLALFTFLFMFAVRWWTDALGRLIAGVLTVILTMMVFASMRLAGIDIPAVEWLRAILYGALGFLMTCANVAFVWYQFIGPRLRQRKRNRLTTPPRKESR
jgi:hypothetical protein